MVRVNVLEGIKPPLPPATPKEILEVCLGALGFCAAAALVSWGRPLTFDIFLRGCLRSF